VPPLPIARVVIFLLAVAFVTGLLFYGLTPGGGRERECPPDKTVRAEDGSCVPESFYEGTIEAPETTTQEAPAVDAPAPVVVRESLVCDPDLHFYGRTYTFGGGSALILVNECLIRIDGGDDEDVKDAWAHERAHAVGWRHYEGTPESNAAYYPKQHLNDGQ
jgi:hypothetical protein